MDPGGFDDAGPQTDPEIPSIPTADAAREDPRIEEREDPETAVSTDEKISPDTGSSSPVSGASARSFLR